LEPLPHSGLQVNELGHLQEGTELKPDIFLSKSVDLHHPQYITNESGEKTAVISPIDLYTELLEDLEDLAAFAERKNEETVPYDKVPEELKADT
jgi:hypothetical protein